MTPRRASAHLWTCAALIGLIACPGLVDAAMLGSATVRSDLGAPLDVRIVFALGEGESLDDMRVGIAPRDRHQALGVPYAAFLGSLNVSVEQVGQGLELAVTSHRALDDFHLEFVVEVLTLRGRVLRGYAILPEVLIATARAPNAMPLRTMPPQAASTRRIPAPSASSPFPRALMPSRTPPDPPAPIVPLPTGAYVLQDGDSLWSLARRMPPAQGSIWARVDALRTANPGLAAAEDVAAGRRILIPGSTDTAVAAVPAPSVQRDTTPASAAAATTASGDRDRIEALRRRAEGYSRVRMAAIAGPVLEETPDGELRELSEAEISAALPLERATVMSPSATSAGTATPAATAPVESALPAASAAGPDPSAAIFRPPVSDPAADEDAPTLVQSGPGFAATFLLRNWTIIALALAATLLAAGLLWRMRASARTTRLSQTQAMDAIPKAPADDEAASEDKDPSAARAQFFVPASIDGRTVQASTLPETQKPAAETQPRRPTVRATQWSPASILDVAQEDPALAAAVAAARTDRDQREARIDFDLSEFADAEGVTDDQVASALTTATAASPTTSPAAPDTTASDVSTAEPEPEPEPEPENATPGERTTSISSGAAALPLSADEHPALVACQLLRVADDIDALTLLDFTLRTTDSSATPTGSDADTAGADAVGPEHARRIRALQRTAGAAALERQIIESALAWLDEHRTSAGRVGLRLGTTSMRDEASVTQLVAGLQQLRMEPSRLLVMLDAEIMADDPDATRAFAARLREAGLGFGLSDALPESGLEELVRKCSVDLVRFDHEAVRMALDDGTNTPPLASRVASLQALGTRVVLGTRDNDSMQQLLLANDMELRADYSEVPAEFLA